MDVDAAAAILVVSIELAPALPLLLVIFELVFASDELLFALIELPSNRLELFK